MKRRELLKAVPLTIAAVAATPLSALIVTPEVQAAAVPDEVRNLILKEYHDEKDRIIAKTLAEINAEHHAELQRRLESLNFDHCPDLKEAMFAKPSDKPITLTLSWVTEFAGCTRLLQSGSDLLPYCNQKDEIMHAYDEKYAPSGISLMCSFGFIELRIGISRLHIFDTRFCEFETHDITAYNRAKESITRANASGKTYAFVCINTGLDPVTATSVYKDGDGNVVPHGDLFGFIS